MHDGTYKLYDPMRGVVLLSQLFIIPLFLLIRLVCVRYRKTSSVKNFERKENMKYVMYANHQSRLDPILICFSLPLPTFLRLLPFRFITANQYLKPPLSKIGLSLLGCYYAYETSGKLYGIEKSRSLLATQQTVVIFPQGTRTREKIAKRGISILSHENSITFIPVHLEWKGRLRCFIHFGEPFRPNSSSTPEGLMEKLYQLPISRS